MSRWFRARALAIAGATVLSACGGSASQPAAAPEAPPPEEPAQAPYPRQQQPGYGAPSSVAPAEDGGEYAQPPRSGGQDPGAAQPTLEQAGLELDRAEAELSAAGSDCARACKALSSMARASEHICTLDPEPGAGGRCQRARARVTEAAERVRRSCACP